MTKTEIIEGIRFMASKTEKVQVKSMLNVTIKILEMSDRRIEGYFSLIRGFTDQEVHKASSEKRGIQYRKKHKA